MSHNGDDCGGSGDSRGVSATSTTASAINTAATSLVLEQVESFHGWESQYTRGGNRFSYSLFRRERGNGNSEQSETLGGRVNRVGKAFYPRGSDSHRVLGKGVRRWVKEFFFFFFFQVKLLG
jgi:hypothetical protein